MIIRRISYEADAALVGDWNLSGDIRTVLDKSGKGHHGHAVNSPRLVQYGKWLTSQFAGDYERRIDCGTDLGVGGVTGSFTVAAWIYLANTDYHGAVFKVGNATDGTGGDGFAFGIGNPYFESIGNNVIALYEGVRWIDTGVACGTGWHHIVMCINESGYASIYLDGKSIYTESSGAAFVAVGSKGTSIATIGGYTGAGSENRHFFGGIKEIKVYRRCLTPGEVVIQYRSSLILKNELSFITVPVSGTQSLTPSLYTASHTFYAPVVTRGAVTLTPSLYTSSHTFYAPTVTRGAVALTPSLFTPTHTFYAPVVTRGAVTLTPSLYTPTHTFYAPVVTRGSVTLTPDLYTAAHTVYGPTVHATYGLTPALYTSTHEFYAPVVTRGAVTLTPSLYTAAHTFYAPVVANTSGPQALTADLYTASHTFYSATVTRGAVGLTPALYTASHTFYAPVVTRGAVSLTPALYTAAHTFYGPVVTRGAVTLTPALYTAAHTFYGPTVSGGAAAQTLTAGLYTATHTFYAHVVTPGTVTITAGLFTSTHEFYAHKVKRAGEDDLTWIDLHPDQAPYISGLIREEPKKKKRRGLDHASPVQDLPYSTGSGKVPTGGGGFGVAVEDEVLGNTFLVSPEIIPPKVSIEQIYIDYYGLVKPPVQQELHAITPEEYIQMAEDDDILALLLLL